MGLRREDMRILSGVQHQGQSHDGVFRNKKIQSNISTSNPRDHTELLSKEVHGYLHLIMIFILQLCFNDWWRVVAHNHHNLTLKTLKTVENCIQ